MTIDIIINYKAQSTTHVFTSLASLPAFIYILKNFTKNMTLTATRVILSFIIPALFLFTQTFSQIPTENPPSLDTTGYYSSDTLRSRPPLILRSLGSLDRSVLIYTQDSAINFLNYRSVTDILSLHPGIFIREFGGLGHIPDVRFNGSYSRQVLFSSDGIQLNDPRSGLYNLFFYPAENIEKIEIIDGTRAFLYGFNSTGGVINFITKSKRAMKPYSRIRYSESGYGFSIIDGMLSQNITRGMNITAGIQHSVFGERFTNEKFDGWNGRIKFRYDLNNTINFYITEIYNQTYLGLSGGIDRVATPDSLRFDNLQAVVRNSDSYEKVTRHDFQAGIAAFPFTDSTAASTLTFYLSSNFREYRDEENRYPSNGIFIQQNQRTNLLGLKILSNFSFGSNRIILGWDVQSQNPHVNPNDNRERTTLLSTFGKIEIPLIDLLNLSSYAKLDSYLDERPLSLGSDLNFTLSKGFEIYGGYSRSFRFPTYIEMYGLDTIVTSTLGNYKPERHHLLEAGLRWLNSNWLMVNLRSFYRITWNPIVIERMMSFKDGAAYKYSRHNKRITEGISGSMTLQTGVLLMEGSAQYFNERDEQLDVKTYPKWSALGGIYYRDNLFRDHLELKAGIQAAAFGTYRSYEFNEQLIDFLPTDAYYDIGSNTIFDIVILAHIGDAYFHVILDNILDTHILMNAFYPLHERRLRFGLNWEFLD